MATVAPDFHINTTKTPHMGSSNCESTQVLFLAFGNSLSLNIPLCACQFHDADIILSSSQNPTTNSKDRDNSPCQPLFSKEMQDMKCFCKRIIGNILTWLSKYADMDHQQMQPCG
jgi:hypothetical protein